MSALDLSRLTLAELHTLRTLLLFAQGLRAAATNLKQLTRQLTDKEGSKS
jgi:hypothetical protein